MAASHHRQFCLYPNLLAAPTADKSSRLCHALILRALGYSHFGIGKDGHLKNTLGRLLRAVFGEVELTWSPYDFGFVEHGMEVGTTEWGDVGGCGLLKHETLREAGYDPGAVSGFAFGLGLERLAVLKFGIDNIHELWQPPYVPE